MNKYLLACIIFIILLTAGLFALDGKGHFFSKKAEAKINNTTFTLDVADTIKKREQGLSGRKSIGEKQGMLFVFDTPTIPSFWMKDMKFPLDILFLSNNKVITVYENVPILDEKTSPQGRFYQPTSPSDKVIELNAGSVKKYNIKIGQNVTLSL